jgi:phosphoglycolate phosphatase
MEKIKQIIWDWNGTLLDDVAMCVGVMNQLMEKYSLPTISISRYKEIFDFPVKAYYKRLGFDFGRYSFEKVGLEFMEAYFRELENTPLFDSVNTTLREIKSLGLNQMVLSAMEHQALEKSLSAKGIRSYFSKVQGIDNHLAHGKSDWAKSLLESSDYQCSETLFVGDTIHDLEVANSLGCSCTLISKGHFSKERLLQKHNLVFDSLDEFLFYLKEIDKKY